MWHGVSVATKPAAYPVDVPTIKQRLDVVRDDQDDMLLALIRGAVARIDGPSGIGVAMMSQTWRKSMDGFPCGAILLPGWPVKSVTSVTYVDSDGTEQTMSASDYRVDINAEPARITPAWGGTWPSTRCVTGAVRVDYVLGESDAADVPADLVDAVCMLVGHRYENREAVLVGASVADLPLGVEAILADYRRGAVAA